MTERSQHALIEPSKTAQRRRGYRLRAARTIGHAIASLVTTARPAYRSGFRIAPCLPPAQ